MSILGHSNIGDTGLGTLIPIELVGSVLEHAVRATINTDSAFAVALQLVSRITRTWLIPIIYEVLVVKWPQRGSVTTPSQAFLVRLVTELPIPAIRAHIHHVAISTRTGGYKSSMDKLICTGEWNLDSVSSDDADLFSIVKLFGLCPRRLFIGHRHGYPGACLAAFFHQECDEAGNIRNLFGSLVRSAEVVRTSWRVRTNDKDETQVVTAATMADEMDKAIHKLLDSQPKRSIHLEIALDFDGPLGVTKIVRLVVALLRCPGVSVALIQSPRPNVEQRGTNTTPGYRKEVAIYEDLWELFSQEPALVPSMRERLTIFMADDVAQPDTSIQYAAAIRSGLRSNVLRQVYIKG